MPNHITNIITSTDMEKLKSLLLNEKDEVDFNKIIPMPKDLEITAGSCDYGESTYFPDSPKKAKLRQAIDLVFASCYDDTISRDEFVKKVMRKRKVKSLICELKDLDKDDKEHLFGYIAGYFNLKRYGSINWYEWCNKNWGTKWNGYDCFVGDDYIQFDTAWSTPKPLLLELSKQVDVTVAYADEDVFGENAGIVYYENGIAERRDIDNLIAFGCAVKGVSADDYGYDESDEFCVKQEDIDKAQDLLDSIFKLN